MINSFRERSPDHECYLPPDMELASIRPMWLLREKESCQLSERAKKLLEDNQGLIFDY